MSKLSKLREIVDQHLQGMTMTESQKAEVRRRIAAGERGRVSHRVYGFAYSAGALALACLLIVFVVLPIFQANSTAPENGSVALDDTENTGDAGSDGDDQDGMTFDVLAAARTSGVVTPDTEFLIEVAGGTISADDLEERITIEPAVSFTLQAEDETLYTLTPSEPFDEGEIVTVSIATDDNTIKSWAFQTDSSLVVESTLPGDKSEGMPLETGIEINFSRMVSSGMENYFEISPAVSGSFQYRGKTVTFVPDQDLAPNTVYTVTINSGLTSDSGETMESVYSFQFRTPSESFESTLHFYSADRFTETFIPGDAIAIGVYASEEFTTANVTLYRVGSKERYLELAKEQAQTQSLYSSTASTTRVSPDGLDKLDTFSADIVTSGEAYWYGPSFVILPDLSEGWYLADIWVSDAAGNEYTIQKLLQVSALSVYYQALNGEALVWLNDAQSGKQVSDAKITLTVGNTTSTTKTGSDGVATFSYDSDQAAYAELSVSAGSRTFVDLVEIDTIAESSASNSYYAYLYLDREIYQPTDTVYYWGILLPRAGAVLPETLQVMASSSGEPRAVGTVSVNADGVFTGTYSFENNISGYVTLSFQNSGETLCSTHYTVMEYTKPAYVLTAEFDQDYYRSGETLSVEINGQFFDGTPASGLELQLSKDEYGEVLTLDGSGNASTTVTASARSRDWTPTSQYISVSTSGAEDVYVSAFDQAYYFPSDYMLTAEAASDHSISVEIQSNAIDFAAFETYLNNYYSHFDDFRGAAADVSGTATLVRCYYEKTPTGSYYDAINKVTVKTYDYELCEVPVYTEEFTTTNGRYVTKPYQNADYSDYAYYRMDISYVSPDGVSFTTSVSLGNHSYPGGYYNGYYLMREDGESSMLQLGETATFNINGTEPVTEGTSLYTVMTDHLLSYDTVKGSTFDLTFEEEMIPNVILYSAYFDGKHVYSVRQAYVWYNYSERELKVDLSTDAESYAPGDTVQGTIHIEDMDGNAVVANYAIGVVDEALFAILDQQIDPTASLYAIRYYREPVRFASYVDKSSNGLFAEGGGDNAEGEPRSDFADTAAFLTGRTDASGNATFSFTLPDNLTSWRITSAVVANDGYAGSATTNVEVSIPFFLNLVLNDSYAAGDDVALSARVYGVEDGASTTYIVSVDGETVLETTGVAGEYTYLNLGTLETGSHELTIFAESGTYRDGITRTILVEESRHELTTLLYGNLSDSLEIDAVKYPVTLFLYDMDSRLYVSALSELLSMDGKRVDQILSRVTAVDLFSTLNPDSSLYLESPEFSSYQRYDGGIRLFPYADPDVLTTALALVTAKDHMDANAAVSYLYDVLQNRNATSGEVAAAYLGLAAMREPVLSDLHILVASSKGFTDSDRLLLGCALSLLGDDNGAAALYEELVLPYVKTTDTWSYLDVGTFEENYKATVYASIFANLSHMPEQDGFLLYLLEHDSAETLPAFALLSYVTRQTLPSSNTSFSCIYNGEKQNWTLSDTPVVVLQFNREELESANFHVTTGEVGYIAMYTGGISSIEENATDLIAVNMTCNSEKVSAGDPLTITVDVTLSEACPGETYTLDLVLPSGTRYTHYDYEYQSGCYLISSEDNRLTFALDRRSNTEGDTSLRTTFSLTIHARAVLNGSFVFEKPIVRCLSASLIAFGEETQLIIE